METYRFMRLDRLQAIFLASAALLALALIAAACGDDGSETVTEDPDIRGTIMDISPGGDDASGSVRIQGIIEADTEYDAAVVRVEDDTDIFRVQNGEPAEAAFADLEVGLAVEAWFTGPVAESYPVQAKAARIVILEDAPAT
jgi:hypothetical protein